MRSGEVDSFEAARLVLERCGKTILFEDLGAGRGDPVHQARLPHPAAPSPSRDAHRNGAAGFASCCVPLSRSLLKASTLRCDARRFPRRWQPATDVA